MNSSAVNLPPVTLPPDIQRIIVKQKIKINSQPDFINFLTQKLNELEAYSIITETSSSTMDTIGKIKANFNTISCYNFKTDVYQYHAVMYIKITDNIVLQYVKNLTIDGNAKHLTTYSINVINLEECKNVTFPTEDDFDDIKFVDPIYEIWNDCYMTKSKADVSVINNKINKIFLGDNGRERLEYKVTKLNTNPKQIQTLTDEYISERVDKFNQKHLTRFKKTEYINLAIYLASIFVKNASSSGSNATYGGKQAKQNKIKTCEKIKIKGRERCVYKGPRGGKYIKVKGEFIKI
jgi:hypothetical protein